MTKPNWWTAESGEEKAERRLEGNILEDDMAIFEGDIPTGDPKLGPAKAEASGPYMGG